MERIGKYRIDRVLGSGAMGTVYQAFDPEIERTVAIKTIRNELLEQGRETLLVRFRNEARAAGRLTHPNIVMVFDLGEFESLTYIVMEFVPGQPLSRVTRTGKPAPLVPTLHWMSQLLEALDYAHGLGVIHRDIKPANLLVTPEDRLKVADFGVARLESAAVTVTGEVAGTPVYMAPEQFLGERVDRRCDVFSAGVVLYQLLTGEQPFAGSMASMMFKILKADTPVPSARNTALPPHFDAVIARALAKDREERFGSAGEFLRALRRAWSECEASGLAVGSAAPAGNWSPDRRPDAPDPGAAEEPTPFERTVRIRNTTEGWPSPGATAEDGGAGGTDHAPLARQDGPAAEGGGRPSPESADRTVRAGPSGSSREPPGFQSSGGRPDGPQQRWDDAVLEFVESSLTRHIGPVARIHIRRVAAAARSAEELFDSLSREIPSEAERLGFLAAVRQFATRHRGQGGAARPADARNDAAGTAPGDGGPGSSDATSSRVDPTLLGTAEQRLVQYIGPIARVMVRRTAREARDRRDFVDRLVALIPDPAQQARFRRDLEAPPGK